MYRSVCFPSKALGTVLGPVRGESDTVSASGLQTGSSSTGPSSRTISARPTEGRHTGTQADTQSEHQRVFTQCFLWQAQEREHTCPAMSRDCPTLTSFGLLHSVKWDSEGKQKPTDRRWGETEK